jgi:hypothetical protein
VATALLVLLLACPVACALHVPPIHGWMMRLGCPLSDFASAPRPIP